jgi:hypothetical protein
VSWDKVYDACRVPSEGNIGEYLGEAKLIWNELTAWIEETYQIKPQITFSKCTMQPGWNIKYKKSGKALCTLYPMEGYFIALVVVGTKEEEEVKLAMEAGLFTTYITALYEKTAYLPMGRWLMIEVKDKAVLNDIRHLLNIRIKPKK